MCRQFPDADCQNMCIDRVYQAKLTRADALVARIFPTKSRQKGDLSLAARVRPCYNSFTNSNKI